MVILKTLLGVWALENWLLSWEDLRCRSRFLKWWPLALERSWLQLLRDWRIVGHWAGSLLVREAHVHLWLSWESVERVLEETRVSHHCLSEIGTTECVLFGDDSGTVWKFDSYKSKPGNHLLVERLHSIGCVKFRFKLHEAHFVLPLEDEDLLDLAERRELVPDALLGNLFTLVCKGHHNDIIGNIF